MRTINEAYRRYSIPIFGDCFGRYGTPNKSGSGVTMPLNVPQEFVFRLRHPVTVEHDPPIFLPGAIVIDPAEIRRTILSDQPITYKRLADLMHITVEEVWQIHEEACRKLLVMFLNSKPRIIQE